MSVVAEQALGGSEPRITNAAKCMKVRCIAKSFGEVIRDTDFSDSEGDLTKLFL